LYHPYKGWWNFDAQLTAEQVHKDAKARVKLLEDKLRRVLQDDDIVLYRPNARVGEEQSPGNLHRDRFTGEWRLSFTCMCRTDHSNGHKTFRKLYTHFQKTLGALDCVLVEL
jgi:hypothetical protein